MLQLKTIHTDTFELLQKLSTTESLEPFALAGGTSLALQLGHRVSIDLDFLSVQKRYLLIAGLFRDGYDAELL